MVIIMVLGSVMVLGGQRAEGAGAPLPTGPYTNSTAGDWWIDAGETVVYKNGTLIINGNLTINGTAALYLENMTVEMHGNITVEKGGQLYLNGTNITFFTPMTLAPIPIYENGNDDPQEFIYRSNGSIGIRNNGTLLISDIDHDPLTPGDRSIIRSNNTNGSYRYFWVNDIGSNFSMNNSLVRDCGWELDVGFFGHPDPHAEHLGLTVMSNNTRIENTTIEDTYCPLLIFGSHNITLKNNTIRNPNPYILDSIFVRGGNLTNPLVGGKTNWTAHDITIKDNLLLNGRRGISLENTYNATIENNTFYNLSNGAIELSNIRNISIVNNNFHNNTGDSIETYGDDNDNKIFGLYVQTGNISICDNRFNNSGGIRVDAYLQYNSKIPNVNISSNYVVNNRDKNKSSIEIAMAGNGSFENTTILSNSIVESKNGLVIRANNRAQDISIISNNFTNVENPIITDNCPGIYSGNNRLSITKQVYGDRSGIYLDSNANFSMFNISDNEFIGNSSGIRLTINNGSISRIIITNNTMKNSGGGISVDTSGSTSIDTLLINNNEHQNNDTGIRLAMNNGSISRAAIEGNKYISSPEIGISIEGMEHASIGALLIKNNNIQANNTGIRLDLRDDSSIGNLSIINNTITDADWGIEKVSWNNPAELIGGIISNNKINNTVGAIRLYGVKDLLVKNNLMLSRPNYPNTEGFSMQHTDNCTLKNNTIDGFTRPYNFMYSDGLNYIENGTNLNTRHEDIVAATNAKVKVINTTMPFLYMYSTAYLEIANYLHIQTVPPTSGVPVVVRNNGGIIYSGTTDADGSVKWILSTYKVFNGGSWLSDWHYNITTLQVGQGAEFEVNMNSTHTEYVSPTGDPLNHAPVLEHIGNYTMVVGEVLNITLHASDPDISNVLHFRDNATRDPDYLQGTFFRTGTTVTSADAAVGFLYLAPTISDVGKHYIRIIVDDGRGINGTDYEDIVITVLEKENSPPVIQKEDNLTVWDGQSINITIHITDEDTEDVLTITEDSDLLDITSISHMPGEYFVYMNYTTTTADVGVHTVNISVDDGKNRPNSYAAMDFTVTILKNSRPQFTASQQQFNAWVGRPLNITLSAYDPDEGDELSAHVNNSDFHIRALNASGNHLTFTLYFLPGPNDTGLHYVNITLDDGKGAVNSTNWLNLIVNVFNNRAPVLEPVPDTLSVVEGKLFSFTASAHDPDGDILSYSVSSNASFVKIDRETGEIEFLALHEYIGTYYLNISVSDGNGTNPGSDWHNGTLTVTPAPVMGSIEITSLDSETDAPLEDVAVTVSLYGSIVAVGQTNAYGIVQLSNMYLGTYEINASKLHYSLNLSLSTITVTLTEASPDASITIYLDKTTKENGYLNVTVLSNDQMPVQGALVTLTHNGSGVFAVQEITNANGNAVLSLVPGTYDIQVSAKGYESTKAYGIDVLESECSNVLILLTPIPPSTISFSLGPWLDWNGNPVPGASVMLSANGYEHTSAVNPDGMTPFNGITPGTWNGSFTYKGKNWNFTITTAEGMVNLTPAQLTSNNGISFRQWFDNLFKPAEGVNLEIVLGPIVDADGNPVVGAQITLAIGNQSVSGTTDNNGSITLIFTSLNYSELASGASGTFSHPDYNSGKPINFTVAGTALTSTVEGKLSLAQSSLNGLSPGNIGHLAASEKSSEEPATPSSGRGYLIALLVVVLGVTAAFAYLGVKMYKADMGPMNILKEPMDMNGTELAFQCPACGEAVTADEERCPACGEEFVPDEYRCPTCGASLTKDDPVCPECGEEFY